MIHLDLQVDAQAVARFFPLLEKGVTLAVNTGCTLKEFLCGQLGMDEAYLERRVQTLFLDARPVDDVATTMVHDGATIALSAAMPGILGATMRKGGRYAAFRRDISQPAGACGLDSEPGRVTLKLFNLVVAEVGPRLLEGGVGVAGNDLVWLLERHGQHLLQAIRSAGKAGQPATVDAVLFTSLAEQPVHLQVTTDA